MIELSGPSRSLFRATALNQMIKSILEDEEPSEESPKKERGLLKGRRKKEDLISIRPSPDEPDPEERPDESPAEIRNGILGLSEPEPGERTAAGGQTDRERSGPEVGPGTDSEVSSDRADELEKMLKELEEELRRERDSEKRRSVADQEFVDHTAPEQVREPEESTPSVPRSDHSAVTETDNEPLSQVEVFRRTGLAWSAAIALFGSVVFMLAIGWVADVLLGSSPWGIVVGVVLGALIGFLQLFRITSQITGRRPGDFEKLSLKASDEPDIADPEPEDREGEDGGPGAV